MKRLVCLLIALGIWGLQQLEEKRANVEVTALLELVLQQPQYREETENTEEPEKETVRRKTMTKEVAEHVYGVLQIEALKLCLPILDTWNETNLQTAPCRYTGEAEDQNLVLLGHNYKKHFAPLEKAQPGQEVRLVLSDGRKFVYSVEERIQIQPTETEKVYGSGYPLTIFTCTKGGENRWVLNCSLQKEF